LTVTGVQTCALPILGNVAEPPSVVTTTSTAPAACGGVVTVADVAVTEDTGAGTPSKATDIPARNPVPATMTEVPPLTGPPDGLRSEEHTSELQSQSK